MVGAPTSPGTRQLASFDFVTVDVFTDRRFGGNPLAVFLDGQGLTDAEMLALSGEMNLSETTFVLPPADPANTARVRIFDRTHEMAFAGHPMVGTGWVLARAGWGDSKSLRFEVPAGVVEVSVDLEANEARIKAPRPLSIGEQLDTDLIAACVGLEAGDVLTNRHAPLVASLGTAFVLVELAPETVSRLQPDLSAFRRAVARYPDLADRLNIYAYARVGDGLHCRMFAPLSDTFEDPATGSAATTLAALTLSLSGQDQGAWDIRQGAEMGRPSVLRTTAWKAEDGYRASVAGGVIPLFTGRFDRP